MLKKALYILFLVSSCFYSFAQKNSNLIINKKDSTKVVYQKMDILAPSRAAFYSAVLPGLGQAYNKKYWKVPIVWGALGTGTYFYIKNNDSYTRYRTAFKLQKAGRPHEFDGIGENPLLSEDALKRAQKVFKKNRDLSMFIIIGLYVLNIVEANVDAHLPDKALDTNISFNPTLFTEPVTNQAMLGATISFKF